MIVFGIDYDDTYTEDPELFDEIIRLCKSRNHIVLMVTARPPTNPVEHDVKIEVFYTSGQEKAPFMREVGGISPSIWIEDMPELVGSRF